MSTNNDDKIWILLSHLSVLFGAGLILPLVVYLWKKDANPNVAAHAKEALNFHITLLIAGLVCFVLAFACVGFFLAIAVGVAAVVLSILAAIRASEGGFFTYPYILRLVP